MALKSIIRSLAAPLAAVAATLIAPMALAQAPVEISFYYPVAVSGPITKLVDGFTADFEKENPGIKVKPIYSGSYQESITKALTAVKSNDAPTMSVLLSTDMFTLIDEDAIVPFDPLIRTPDDQTWLKAFYPAFMENSQTGGKTWGIPFQRSTIDFGVAMLPASKRRGSPTGGGNFYLFKQSKPEQQAAALKFIKWITAPQRAAQWGIDTGYVAVRPDAWEMPAMKKYVGEFPPAAVARDQLQYAVAELSTHDNQRVTKALNDGLQAALTGTKAPEQAMKDAQRESERLLRPYK